MGEHFGNSTYIYDIDTCTLLHDFNSYNYYNKTYDFLRILDSLVVLVSGNSINKQKIIIYDLNKNEILHSFEGNLRLGYNYIPCFNQQIPNCLILEKNDIKKYYNFTIKPTEPKLKKLTSEEILNNKIKELTNKINILEEENKEIKETNDNLDIKRLTYIDKIGELEEKNKKLEETNDNLDIERLSLCRYRREKVKLVLKII